METYKIGNKINCIIRSFSSGPLGEDIMQYDNQPYTVVKDVEASLRFTGVNSSAKVGSISHLAYNMDQASNLQLTNVPINSRTIALIYDITKDTLCNTSVNIEVNRDSKLSLNHLLVQHGVIYQVFIYDINRKLVGAYGVLDESSVGELDSLVLEEGNYLVFYSYLGSIGYKLSKQQNPYVSLDIEVQGNESDSFATYYIHLDKCALSADKNLYFKGGSNTVDLNFTILASENDYITIK